MGTLFSMHLMTRRIGGLTLTAMAGFSNNNYSAPLGALLNGGKEMYARLDKLREDLQKAIAKRDEAEKRIYLTEIIFYLTEIFFYFIEIISYLTEILDRTTPNKGDIQIMKLKTRKEQ